jgi:hypothetical protein
MLIVTQLVKKYTEFDETRRPLTVFREAIASSFYEPDKTVQTISTWSLRAMLILSSLSKTDVSDYIKLKGKGEAIRVTGRGGP